MLSYLSKMITVLLCTVVFLSACSSTTREEAVFASPDPSDNPTHNSEKLSTAEVTEASVDASTDSDSKITTEEEGDNSNVMSDVDLNKVLIVYYSFSGTTEGIANKLIDLTGGDAYEIQPDFDYYRADLEDVAQQQINEGFQPELLNPIPDINSYDVIFVGSPIWWFTVTPPLRSFLSQSDLSDKLVVPFCTYKTDYGTFFEDFEAACPDANLLTGMHFSSMDLQDEVSVTDRINERLLAIEEELQNKQ